MRQAEILKQQLKKNQLDGLLVSNFSNILYLSGFKGLSQQEREAWVLVTKKNNYFFTDARYSADMDIFQTKLITPEKNIVVHLSEIAKAENLQKIGFESNDLTVAEFNRFSKYVSLTATEKIILNLRAIKTTAEIANVKKACQLADQCLTDIVRLIKPGVTEKELSFKIEFWLKKHGSDLAFYPIIAVDQNAALPHYDTKTNGITKIKHGSVVLIDFGAVYDNYLSDMTRMVFVGKPSDEMAKSYEILLKAQTKAIYTLTQTDDPKQIDGLCRKIITENSEPDFPHSTGHGVGLEIHEEPKISSKSTDTLAAGHVFTIEPGIHKAGKYGMRIEDTVYLEKDKTPIVLTQFSKKMLLVLS